MNLYKYALKLFYFLFFILIVVFVGITVFILVVAQQPYLYVVAGFVVCAMGYYAKYRAEGVYYYIEEGGIFGKWLDDIATNKTKRSQVDKIDLWFIDGYGTRLMNAIGVVLITVGILFKIFF